MNDAWETGETVRLHDLLDQGRWEGLQQPLLRMLGARKLDHLAAPALLVVHELLDCAVQELHLHVFRNVLETDLNLQLENTDQALLDLYRVELKEHGTKNIAHACQLKDCQLTVCFPDDAAAQQAVLVRLAFPFPVKQIGCHNEKLLELLGFGLETENTGAGSRVDLVRLAARDQEADVPTILTATEEMAYLQQIYTAQHYGLIRFTAMGKVVSASPALLERLGLEHTPAALAALEERIPLRFHHEITWGLALEGDGAFENYRVRLTAMRGDRAAMLFNVSGVRHADGVLDTLWQLVSEDKIGHLLAEGSILNEARVNNILRHYVPQLVKQKARESVSLGKTSIGNEERTLAVLFCDIVGFTSFAEHCSEAESVIDTLNSILHRVSLSVIRHQGSIDKFMGDAVMAFFDDPANALLAAVDMQSHSDDINALRSRAGQQVLQLRIGMHWGRVVVGNVGTDERLDWTAIGDVVNTASRIERNCAPGSILISVEMKNAVAALHTSQFAFGETHRLNVKGKKDALEVCYVRVAGMSEG